MYFVNMYIFTHYNCDTTIVSEYTLVACTTFFKNGKLSSIDSFLIAKCMGNKLNGMKMEILNQY